MAEIASFRARSKEGHAAVGGISDRWIEIQRNTFTNWVNEQLRQRDLDLNDLETDLCDGIKLCCLVEVLQGKRVGKVIKKVVNPHQSLENVTQALTAIANDNVRLVNIGSEDIVNGNIKLILGLVWHLILRYQIGKSKFPPKKLMLAWLQAVIPECNITNFTSDWNDGVALHALIDYCRPGLCPNWRTLSRHDRLENCRYAMELAKQHFDIPLVVRPEDLSSPDLDELSGMTYLSYYMKVDSPGYHATLNGVNRLYKQGKIGNFTSEWSDGRVLCGLVKSLGGNVSGWPHLTGTGVENLGAGIDGARKLGVEPILSAEQMAEAEVDHIGIMAYAAYFNRLRPMKPAAEKVVIDAEPRNVFVGLEGSFALRLEDEDVSPGDITAEIIGPDSSPSVKFDWEGRSGHGYFTPTETGHHRLNVFCENELIARCPVSFKVSADREKVSFYHPETCTLGEISEFQLNTAMAGQGDVQVEARSPSGRLQNLSPVYRNGSYTTNFDPAEVGDWRVSVMYDGDHIRGSPYTVRVNDPTQVSVYGLEGGTVGHGLSFHADSSRAGDGNIRVQVNHGGDHIPAFIRQESDGLHKIDFTPTGAGTYMVNVFFNEREVRGSPFKLEIVDSSKVTVSGDGLTLVPVNKNAKFTVNTHGAHTDKVNVDITAPSGRTVSCNISQTDGTSEQEVDYVPTEVGDHTIVVKCGDHEINGCPFTAKSYDTSAIEVTPLPGGVVGQPIYFHIDVTRAGEGQLEIMVNNGNLPNTVESERVGVYKISFVPEQPGIQYVDINFNQEGVPGSSFSCNAVDIAGAHITGMSHVLPVNQKTNFTIHSEGAGTEMAASVDVYSPDGSQVPVVLRQAGDDEYTVEWIPPMSGSYRVDVMHGTVPAPDSPFIIKVFDPSKVKVTTDGTGRVNEEVTFDVDVHEAGEGELLMEVHCGDLTVPSTITQTEQGRFKASFLPVTSDTHYVHMTFNHVDVPGAPFPITMEGEHGLLGAGITDIALNVHQRSFLVEEVSWFLLGSGSVPVDRFDIHVQAPNGDTIPSRILSQSDGNYRVEWTPSMPGQHKVDVQVAGAQVEGSPFHVNVIDLSRIFLDNFHQGSVGDQAGFDVDFSEAGVLEHNIHIVGASGREVAWNINEVSYLKKRISYLAEEGGPHKIFITYGGYDLPGCPYVQEIEDGGLPTATGDGLYRGEEDKTATFYVDAQRRRGNLNVQVAGPNSIAKVNVEPQSDGRYTVNYVPVEVGTFDVHIRFNDREVSGSPFHPRVVDPRKVRIFSGWQHYMDSSERLQLVVDEEKQLPFDVSEAGPGKMRVEVVGPTRTVPVTIDDHTVGRVNVYFTPMEEGNHYIHVFWSDLALQGSPYLAYAVAPVTDSNKVILTGRGLKEASVREEAEFNIDGSQAGPGSPEVTLTGVRAEINVKVTPVGNGRYHCIYIPIVPGAYLLHITWNGRQLRGSPYKVNVIGAFYPNKVVVTGEGLRGGILERDMEIKIDTRKAGPGELTAYCMGPQHVAYCELEDNHDGTYRLSVRPKEPGRHVLQIKYGGEHVLGSPFVLRVSAQPDASKVRVTGPGVEHGILANFQSRFIVETRGAGAGQLTVRIRGPKGAFQVEMYRDSQRDRTILCRYDPTEVGLYIVNIKWSGVDVPGSPFKVNIVDTQQELEQLLLSHDASFTNSSITPRGGSASGYTQWQEAQWRADI